MIVSYHGGSGNQIQSFWKNSYNHFSSLFVCFFETGSYTVGQAVVNSAE